MLSAVMAARRLQGQALSKLAEGNCIAKAQRRATRTFCRSLNLRCACAAALHTIQDPLQHQQCHAGFSQGGSKQSINCEVTREPHPAILFLQLEGSLRCAGLASSALARRTAGAG